MQSNFSFHRINKFLLIHANLQITLVIYEQKRTYRIQELVNNRKKYLVVWILEDEAPGPPDAHITTSWI